MSNEAVKSLMDKLVGDEDTLPQPAVLAYERPADGLKEQLLKEEIVEVLRTIYDPEIPVDIYELGLIYDLRVDPEGRVEIDMTLTSPACPVAGTLPVEVENKVAG